MKKKLVGILICLCFVLLTAVKVNAQLPGIINFQAKIADNNGIPLNGLHTFNFSIIEQNSNILWSANNIQIMIENGLYSVKLGDAALGMEPIPSSIFDGNDETFLRIFVDGEQLSDQQILPTGYAFKSEKSDDTHKIAGNPVSGTPNTNQVLKWNGSQWEPGTDEVGGLTLPYSGTNSTSSDAFNITHTSSSGSCAEFVTTNSSNGGETVYIRGSGHSAAVALYVHGWGNTYAIYAVTGGGTYAGYFSGDVGVSGTLSKGAGSFMIDHPLDPENKYLYHSFVESPDMMNVYNGNIILDSNGEAKIELPDWFEALNKDFKYQLTCIGGFAPVYVSEEVSNNMFKISGGDPGMKISWQVTGIRQDPFANQNRIQVEVEKSSKEKGHYLHYKEYNQPIENSIEAVRHPDILEDDNSDNN